MPPKRRRKYHGLYYHSSPPKVLPMNGNSNSSKASGRDESKEAFVVKPSSIRIWIHDKDVGKLTRVLWAGHGNRLRTETSANPRVKKFLETVPYVLNVIKDVHQATVDNNLDLLKSKTESPVPPSLITTKDSNGLTVMHKAAGLAHTRIVEYLLKVWPGGATDIDATGKTPLHWAASAKNNTRCYNLLVQAGADEEALDYRMKTAANYKHKPNDIDRSLLTVVPEAPRVPNEGHPDWSALIDEIGKLTNSQSDLTADIENNNNKNEESQSGNGINLLTTRTKANSTIEDTLEPDDLEDGNNKLTIEEQAIKDAIEDERIYEEEQSEMDARRQEEENEEPEVVTQQDEQQDIDGNNGDVNGNGETPPSSPTPTANVVDDVDDGDMELDIHPVVGNENEKENNDDDNLNASSVKEIEAAEKDRVVEAIDNIKNATAFEENEPQSEDHEKSYADVEKQENMENCATDTQTNDNEPEEDVKTESRADLNGEAENNAENDEEVLNEPIITQIGVYNTEKHDEVMIDQKISQNEAEPKSENNKHVTPSSDHADTEGEHESNDETTDDVQIEKPESAKSKRSESAKSNHTITSPPKPPKTPETENLPNGDKGGEKNENVDKDSNSEEPISKSPEKNSGYEASDSKKSDEDDDDQEIVTSNGQQIDENHNPIKSSGAGSITPVTPALEYEGVVQGEPDDNQVQSQSGGYFTNEVDRIQSIIDSGDMEQLATLVLNGEGKKLLGARSAQPEIQAFLDNVPSYMNKIRRVHQAARNGNIRDLQSALDRRKFAIAKDEISANGATPLHVATIFGHAGIIRYLGGRFPETTSAIDDNGRTALHYAATINDNGHFYNILMNLGSNPKSLDKIGNSADYYKDNRQESMKVFSYQSLLKAFGASEDLENEMLSDQDKFNTISNQLEIPLFRTEQGQYLAEALGDPLIKGLTEIAEKRPAEPILYLANFLYNFAKNNSNNHSIQQHAYALTQQRQPQQHSPNRQGTGASVSGHLGQPTTESSNYSVPLDAHNQSLGATEEVVSSPELDDPNSGNDDRDEHGQSMLHFACARPHSRNALLNLIEESEVNIAYRDELYRTARDVSLQANQPANAKQIDHYVLSLATKGDQTAFENMVLEGYDHILDVTDDQGENIVEFTRNRGHSTLADFLETIHEFEELREELHTQIRSNNMVRIKELLSGSDPARLIRTKNYYGRTALHIAVLKENEALVDYLTDTCRNSLKIGDNLERTALHYAMGINSVEKISRILIRKGAKRIVKDLKGRQPSYYFMNKADILRLQEEEDEDHGIE